ncbi:Teneurin3like [Caligus rogercresseyi]|uniref:Teneurin3like n=1 Tax=Caligus rogercresseyi TaxID=217165 RepID=A0A7T8K8W7_CALRO|nr:Teneurin3like [Caligus rogercresseyi]
MIVVVRNPRFIFRNEFCQFTAGVKPEFSLSDCRYTAVAVVVNSLGRNLFYPISGVVLKIDLSSALSLANQVSVGVILVVEVDRAPDLEQMTVRRVGKVIFTRAALEVCLQSFHNAVVFVIFKAQGEHFLSSKPNDDGSDPTVSIKLYTLEVIVVDVLYEGLVVVESIHAEIGYPLDLPRVCIVHRRPGLLFLIRTDDAHHGGGPAISVILVSEDSVVKDPVGEAYLLFLKESHMVLVLELDLQPKLLDGHKCHGSRLGVVLKLHLCATIDDPVEAVIVIVDIRHRLISVWELLGLNNPRGAEVELVRTLDTPRRSIGPTKTPHHGFDAKGVDVTARGLNSSQATGLLIFKDVC